MSQAIPREPSSELSEVIALWEERERQAEKLAAIDRRIAQALGRGDDSKTYKRPVKSGDWLRQARAV